LLILADIQGTGILSLPYAFAQLNWSIGLTLLILCWPLNFFTGYLLNKVHLAMPKCVTFGDVGKKLAGPAGGIIGYGSLYFYIVLLLGNYFIVLSKAMQGIFWSWYLCRWVAGLMTMVILIPTNQLRTLHSLTAVSVFSSVTIALVCIIYMVNISTSKGGDVPCVEKKMEDVDNILLFAKVLSKFVFAFSGQKIFLEMQAEMKHPEQFVRSMNLAFPFLVAAYGSLSILTLARCGDHAPSYILDALDYSAWRTIANILLFGNISTSYVIAQQVLSRAIALRVMPTALTDSASGRLSWFALTSALMVVGWVLSNAIPLFSDFVSLMGALLSTQMSFGFPCILYLGVRNLGKVKISAALDRTLVALVSIVLLLSVALTVFGTLSAIQGIITDAEHISPPFSCLCTAKQCKPQ